MFTKLIQSSSLKKAFSTHYEFIKHLKKGDEVAYAHLIKTYYKPLCEYAFGLSRDTFKAEDIVQNVLIRIWEQRNKIKPDLCFVGVNSQRRRLKDKFGVIPIGNVRCAMINTRWGQLYVPFSWIGRKIKITVKQMGAK